MYLLTCSHLYVLVNMYIFLLKTIVWMRVYLRETHQTVVVLHLYLSDFYLLNRYTATFPSW